MSTSPSVCGGYGIRGDKGESGPGVFFQGPWDPDRTYTTGDMVTTGEGIFIATGDADGETEPPGEPWSLLVLWDEITGPPGPAGPAGPAGTTYAFTQTTPSSVWNIQHNLGYYPAITVIDTSGHVVYADIEHLSTANALVNFPSPATGMASCT